MGAFNGLGQFIRSYSWTNDAANGIPISSSRMDTEDNGFAAGLSNCVTRDGQSPATANIPLGGFRITNGADPVDSTDFATARYADSQTNVGAYADKALSYVGTFDGSPANVYGNDQSTISVGFGASLVARYHRFNRIDATVNYPDGTTGGGSGFFCDSIEMHVGGPNLTTVPVARHDFLIYDATSPNHQNPNAGIGGGYVIATVDGTTAGGFMSLFGGCGSYIIGGPAADHVNLNGPEFDMGSVNRSAGFVNRSGTSFVSIGSVKGAADGDNCITVAGGPQLIAQQDVNKAGWRNFVWFSRKFAPDGYNDPLSDDANVMGADGGSSITNILNFNGTTITGSVIVTPHNQMSETGFAMTGVNHGIELGSVTITNTPFMDFHSSGNNIDYDARITCAGGSASVGNGALNITAGSLNVPTTLPAFDNGPALGSASKRWSAIYSVTAVVVGSDERIKRDIQPLDQKWVNFILSIHAKSYILNDISIPATSGKKPVRRLVTKTVQAEREIETTINGQRAFVLEPYDKEVPVDPVAVPVFNPDGTPVMEEGPVSLTDDVDKAGLPIKRVVKGQVQRMRYEPVYEDAEEDVTTDAIEQSHARRHSGFIAQEIRQAITDAGLDGEGDTVQRSIWGLFAYDEEVDLFMLRYEEFTPLLVLTLQSLSERIKAIEHA